MGFVYHFSYVLNANDMGVMGLPNGPNGHVMGKFEKNLGTSRKNICVERCFELFSRVGWGGFGKLQSEAWGGVVWAAHISKEWGGKGLGSVKTNHEKGFGCFMVPKSGVGRVWEGSK